MIRFFEKRDKNAVISLWQEAFSDEKGRIERFLEFAEDNVLLFLKNGEIVSMLTLLSTKIGAEKGRYVYAVATDKRFRNNGYAGALIEYAKCLLAEKDEKFLVLLPQDKPLFEFYRKHGFSELFCAEKVRKSADYSKKIECDVEKIDAVEYLKRRNSYFKEEKYVNWDKETLIFMQFLYDGSFVLLKREGKPLALAFCHKSKDELFVHELLLYENIDKVFSALANFFSAKEIFCLKAKNNSEPFAMIYPASYRGTYFGLGMNF